MDLSQRLLGVQRAPKTQILSHDEFCIDSARLEGSTGSLNTRAARGPFLRVFEVIHNIFIPYLVNQLICCSERATYEPTAR